MSYLKQARKETYAEFRRLMNQGLKEMGLQGEISPRFAANYSDFTKAALLSSLSRLAEVEGPQWLGMKKVFSEYWGRQGRKDFISLSRYAKGQKAKEDEARRHPPGSVVSVYSMAGGEQSWVELAKKRGFSEADARRAFADVEKILSGIAARQSYKACFLDVEGKRPVVFLNYGNKREIPSEAGHAVYTAACKARGIKPNDAVGEFFDAAFRYSADAKDMERLVKDRPYESHLKVHDVALGMLQDTLRFTKDPKLVRRVAYRLAEREIGAGEDIRTELAGVLKNLKKGKP
jgi:hypothetical protein